MAAVSSTTTPSVIVKCWLDGNSDVGKTSILLRYSENIFFSDQFTPSIGVDFRIKRLGQNDMEIKLQIWDRGGRQVFRTPDSTYYRAANLILAIFAVDDAQSFEHLNNRLTAIENHRPENSVVAVVANKIDVPASLRIVTSDMGRALAESRGCAYYEVSAKTGENIDAMFQDMVTRFLANQNIASSTPTPTLTPATDSCILQ